MGPIYMDYNATTPVDPRVVAAMLPFLTEHFGNPSSNHWFGVQAKMALARARSQAAQLLGCAPVEVVFTSGGSEANNLAIKGVAHALRGKGNHIITTQVEHPAVLNPCRFLEALGYAVDYLPVDRWGRVDPDDVRQAIRKDTILISVMHANNEVGTLQPIAEIAGIARQHGVIMHTDAAQTPGRVPVDVVDLGVDLLSLAGHKFYGPKGVGALFVREGTPLEPLIHGAGHERGQRAGTENVSGIMALGRAAELAIEQLPDGASRLRTLRDRLWQGIQDAIGDVHCFSPQEGSLPNTLSVSVAGLRGEEILDGLEGVAASTGSACHAGERDPSHVLAAMGIPREDAMGAMRFSLGHSNTEDEVDRVVAMLAQRVKSLRAKTR